MSVGLKKSHRASMTADTVAAIRELAAEEASNEAAGEAANNATSEAEAEASRDARKLQLEFFYNIIAGADLLVVFLVSLLPTIWVNHTSQGKSLSSLLSNSKAAIGTLGAFYSFALVFRTNICYARWWEGRSLWGTMLVNSIRIAQQGRLWIHDKELRDRLSCLAITFAYACKARLRGHSLKEDDGPGLVERGVLTNTELRAIDVQNTWQPFYCLDAMRSTVNEGLYRETQDWRRNAAMREFAFEGTIGTLASSIGGCIKVQSTGLPSSYDDILKAIGNIFFLFASLAWASDMKFYNPVLVLTIYTVVKMITAVGNDMEDPFGHDVSDLPLDKFCATIERQINSIDEREDKLTFDLALGSRDDEADVDTAPRHAVFKRLRSYEALGGMSDVELGPENESGSSTGCVIFSDEDTDEEDMAFLSSSYQRGHD